MDNKKLSKKIRDWTVGLGFRLPDGSAPPPDFFAFLTVTPNRRQLWETLMESVQPRQKVQLIRKQIFVAKLQEKKKHLSRCDSKQITDRIDLWYKQDALESEVNEKRKVIIKMERNIMEKASGLLFEIYKLAELENQIKELSEKSMVLKLLSKREMKIMEDLNRDLLKVKALFCSKSGLEDPEGVKNELLNGKECKCLQDDTQECNLLNQVKKVCESGVTEQQLWEEVIRWKKATLCNFSAFLKELNCTGKNVLSDKTVKVEMDLSQSVTELKQKILEKSLQTLINSVEGKQLDLEIDKLEKQVLEGISCSDICDEALKTISSQMYIPSENSEATLKNTRNYLNVIGLKNYQEFLKGKTKKLEEETLERKRRGQLRNSEDGKERLQESFKHFESIVDEVNSLKLEEIKVEGEIIAHHKALEAAFQTQEDVEAKSKARYLEDVTGKLKLAAEEQVNLLLETPLGAFKTVKSSSGRIIFECESASHCLKGYNGELKHFFSAKLIPPSNDLRNILSEIDRRKKSLNQVRSFISEREKLASLQRRLHAQIVSLKFDSQLCEKNYKESGRILWSVSSKAEELLQDIDFVEKILKNWVEQPYRLMVRETVDGESLREYEEKFRKAMKN